MLSNLFVYIFFNGILNSLYIKLSCKHMQKFITRTKSSPTLPSHQRKNLLYTYRQRGLLDTIKFYGNIQLPLLTHNLRNKEKIREAMVYTTQQCLNFTIQNLLQKFTILLWKTQLCILCYAWILQALEEGKAVESNTEHPRPEIHTGLSPTGSHTEMGYGSHTAQHAEIILIKIFLKWCHFPKSLHLSENLPLNTTAPSQILRALGG